MTVRLIAIVTVLASGATGRADLPPGAVLRLADDRLFHGSDSLVAVAFTPDGQHLLTCGTPAGVDVWDATTGRPVRRLPGPGVYPVVVSPDGRWVAGGGRDGAVVWDFRSGQRFAMPPPPPTEAAFRAHGVAFTPDSAGVIAASQRGRGHELRLLAVPTLRELARVEAASMDVTPQLGVTADGRSVLIAMGKGIDHYELPALTSGRPRVGFGGPAGTMGMLAPDGRWTLSCPAAGPLTVADVATGKTVWTEAVDAPSFYQFTADGQTLLVLERPATGPCLTVRDAATGRLLRRVAAPEDYPLFYVTPDGKRAVFVGTRKLLRLWDTETGKPLTTPAGHDWGVRAVAVVAGGRTAVTADKVELRGWDLANGRPTWAVPFSAAGKLLPLPDGRAFVAVGYDGRMEVRAVDDGRRLRELAAAGPAHQPWLLGPPVLTADGRAVVGYELREPQKFEIVTTDVATGAARREPTPRLMHTSQWPSRFSSGFEDRNPPPSLHLFDVVAGRRQSPFAPNAYAVATTADGRTAAETTSLVVNSQGIWGLRVRDVLTGQDLSYETGKDRGLSSPVFAPDGRTIAGSSHKAWSLVAVADGRVIQRREVNSPVAAFAFTPDGRRLLTAHDDGSALVWDLPPAVAATLPEAWWADLAGENVGRAYAAVHGLAATGDRGVALVAERLRLAEAQPPPLTNEQVKRLLAGLDAAAFADREAAERTLASAGETVEPTLRRALDDGPSVEVQRRIQRVLERLAVPGPEARRAARAVWALELIGTPAARRELERLAGGADGARLTREAQAALDRRKPG